MLELRQGNRVRRADWSIHRYWEMLDDYTLYAVTRGMHTAISEVPVGHVLATDWESYELTE